MDVVFIVCDSVDAVIIAILGISDRVTQETRRRINKLLRQL